jgi:uncharacterized protein YjbI with pentapeptide repeats
VCLDRIPTIRKGTIMFSDNQVLFDTQYRGIIFNNTDFKHLKMIKGELHNCEINNSDLTDTTFYSTYFTYVNFTESNLRLASFVGCYFRDTTFTKTELEFTSFIGCKLNCSFINCNLDDCALHSNDYRGIRLKDTPINWDCHDLIGEVLRQEAGNDTEKIKVAGYIAIQKYLCWRHFLSINDPLKSWAIGVLRSYPGFPSENLRSED